MASLIIVQSSSSNLTVLSSIPRRGFTEVEESSGDGGPGGELDGVGFSGFAGWGLADGDEVFGRGGVLFEVGFGVVEKVAEGLAFFIGGEAVEGELEGVVEAGAVVFFRFF